MSSQAPSIVTLTSHLEYAKVLRLGTLLAIWIWRNMKHTAKCTMAFGRVTKEIGACERCDELRSGAAPRKGWGTMKKIQEQTLSEAIRRHYSSGECPKTCSPVCTRFDW